MVTQMTNRRLTDRLKAQENIFVNVNNCLCTVYDISLEGIAFDYTVDPDSTLKASDTLEIFFMSGPILYIENVAYTIVADIPLPAEDSNAGRLQRRACTRFDDLNLRQIIGFNHLMAHQH